MKFHEAVFAQFYQFDERFREDVRIPKTYLADLTEFFGKMNLELI